VSKLDSDKKEFDVLGAVRAGISSLYTNVKICSENNAVKNGKVVHLEFKDPIELPICDLRVYTDVFKT
jgi:hypothetical protein